MNKITITNDEPIQYQRGFAEFYKLKFLVNSAVLIPRPETELLVEQVIKANPTTVLEIGTGSGCIAIPIAKNLPECKVEAVDISQKALNVAKKNAKLHGVEKQIQFIKSDLLSFIPSLRGIKNDEAISISMGSPRSARDDDYLNYKVDWIVANLPYIPTSRISTLDSSVKDFEPHLALDGGSDGFDLYRNLFIQMIEKNIYPLYFLGEIDIVHEALAVKEAKKYFPKAKVEIKNDLTQRPRFLVISF